MLHDYDAAEEFRDDDMLMYSEREFSGSSGGGRGNKKAKASNRLEEFDSAPEDEETEKEVMKAVEGLKGEMTILIITHRLSTLSCCDKIYKVDNKKLVVQ